MFRRIFLTAILAGVLAGLFLSALQAALTTPLIIEAETYETAAPAQTSTPAADAHDEEAWGPAGVLERTLYTSLANVIAGVGFALLLTAAFALRGEAVDGRRGAVWGLAGFLVFSAAPALGLPPELPGSMAAELPGRQAWWLVTVLASGLGLWLLVFGRTHWQRALAMLLLVAPHAVGAPHPEAFGGPVPPELAGHFAAASLVSMAAFWACLGWLAGNFYRRIGADAAASGGGLAERAT